MVKKPKKKLCEFPGERLVKLGEKKGKHRIIKVGDKRKRR